MLVNIHDTVTTPDGIVSSTERIIGKPMQEDSGQDQKVTINYLEKEKLVETQHPTFKDFLEITHNPNSHFPGKFIVFNGNHGEVIVKTVSPRGFNKVRVKEDESLNEIDFVWSPLPFLPRFYYRIDKANARRDPIRHIVVNHLENIKGMVTKTGIIFSLRRYYKNNQEAVSAHYSIFDSIPTSFIVLPDCQDAEYHAFVQRFNEIEKGSFAREKLPSKHCENNLWLIKPAAQNQGRGIEIFHNDLAGMKKFLESKLQNTYWVVQKYIERPLLYRGRKFDIRMWAVITFKNELWYYRKGYIRTSSDEYSLDKDENYVHLTNNCLQQFGEKYGKFEEGNTISFDAFEGYLQEQYPELNINFDLHFIPRIKDLMIDSYLAVRNEINPAKRRNCFELLGYDFMIDEDFRVWMIEINSNPYLGIPNKYIEGLLPKMLNDMFEMVLDPVIKPVNELPVRETKNQFELLYEEKKRFNQRRSFGVNVYPFPEVVPKPKMSFTSKLYKPQKCSPKEKIQVQKSKELKKKVDIPLIPKCKLQKKLVEEVMHFNGSPAEFITYSQRVQARFANSDLIPEADLQDAISSISILSESKFARPFFSSPLFEVLAKMALNFTKELPTNIRKVLFNFIIQVSIDISTRQFLMSQDLVHSLMDLALSVLDTEPKLFCNSNTPSEDEIYTLESVKILHKLSYFDRPKFYIPGETSQYFKNRLKFMSLGGIVTLFFLYIKAQNIQHHIEEIKSLCESIVLKEMDLKDFEYNIYILKKYTDSKSSTDLQECPSQKHGKSEECLKRNAIFGPGSEEHFNETKLQPFEEQFLLGEVNFSVELLKKLQAKELLPIIEAQFQIRKVEWYENLRQLENLRIVQKEEELKKKEEERQKRDKNEQAFQDYIKKIEQRKKEQAEQRKKIIS